MWQIASGYQRRSGRLECIPLNVLPFVWCDRGFAWPRTVGQTGGDTSEKFLLRVSPTPFWGGVVSYSEYGNKGKEGGVMLGGVCGCFVKKDYMFLGGVCDFRIQIMGYGVESNRGRNVVRDGCFVCSWRSLTDTGT